MSSYKRAFGGQPEKFPHQNALESTFDRDLSHLDVHTGERGALNAIGANGLASGNTIAVGDACPTLELMGHEVAHCLQNENGNTGGLTTNLWDSAENEANRAGAAAASGGTMNISGGPTGALAGDWFTGAAIGGALGGLLGGPVGAVAGGVVGGLIQDALSDDEEQAPAPASTPEPAAELSPREQFEADIRADNADISDDDMASRLAGYDVQAGWNLNPLYHEDSTATVDLSSDEARMAALNNFSQNHMAAYDDDTDWENMCGATSMMAAVMMGSGGAGVADLAQSLMANQGDDMSEFMQDEYRAIIERANNNELTHFDLMTLTDQMHKDMRAFDEGRGEGGQPGVTGPAIGHIVDQNPAIAAAMREGGIGLSSADTDGDGAGNHWFLRLGLGDSDTSNNAIYDPMAPTEGGNVRTGRDTFFRYVDASPQTN